MRLPLPLLAAVMIGCEIYSSPSPFPCPGERLATFSFSGKLWPGSACTFAADPNQAARSLGFVAALHQAPDGGAAFLCRDVARARLWEGTFQADLLDVSTADLGAATPSCGCPLEVVDRIVGSVQRDGGVPAAFAGDLYEAVGPADGGPAGGGSCGCGLPCEIRYRLTGTAIGGR